MATTWTGNVVLTAGQVLVTTIQVEVLNGSDCVVNVVTDIPLCAIDFRLNGPMNVLQGADAIKSIEARRLSYDSVLYGLTVRLAADVSGQTAVTWSLMSGEGSLDQAQAFAEQEG